MSTLTNVCCVFVLVGLAMGQAPLTTEEAAKVKAKAVADCRNKYKDLTDAEAEAILIKRTGAITKTGNCFIACVLKACEYFAPNNTVLDQNIRDRLDRTRDQSPPDEYPKKVKVLEFCKSNETKEADECVAAHSFIACIMAKKKEFDVTTKMW